MIEVEVAGRRFPAEVVGYAKDTTWDDRDSKSIKSNLSYEDASTLFRDNVRWSIIVSVPPQTDEKGNATAPRHERYDNSEYSVAGTITVNRDGTTVVKMGKPTDHELLEALRRKVGE